MKEDRFVFLCLTCSFTAREVYGLLRGTAVGARRLALRQLIENNEPRRLLRPFRKLAECEPLARLFDVAGYRDGRGRNLLHLACGAPTSRFEDDDDEVERLLLVPLLVQLGVSLFDADARGRLPVDGCPRHRGLAVYSCVVSHMERVWTRERALVRALTEEGPSDLTRALPADLARLIVERALPSAACTEARLRALL